MFTINLNKGRRCCVSVKLILIVTTFFISLGVKSQVQFLFNTTVGGRDVQGLTLLKMMNTTSEAYEGVLTSEVKSMNSGMSVFKATYAGVHLNPGINSLSPNSIGSATYWFSSSESGDFIRQTGRYPEGELEFCFSFVSVSKTRGIEVFEDCALGTNILSSPIELLLPTDEESICDQQPRFTWQPPMPLQAGLNYTFKLVELSKDQSPVEALQLNKPLVYQSNIYANFLRMPPAAGVLTNGKVYAWQVTAKSNSGYRSTSNISTFTQNCSLQRSADNAGSFWELRPYDDGSFHSTGQMLRFAVHNYYDSSLLDYTIIPTSGDTTAIDGLPIIQLQKGVNDLTIDLHQLSGIIEDEEYTLTVILPNGDKVFVRFKYEL